MANLNIAIAIAAVDNASGPIGNIKNALGGMGDAAQSGFSGLQNLTLLAGGAALAGVGALGTALYTSVDAAMDAQQGQAELNAVLASTQGAAGMTADAVNDLASQYQALTPFEDDVILAGENMLLTFTNIGKDVFPMATEAMLNMGQKFGSVDAAAVQLGKALNDPIAGVSALRKVGVTLTEAQEEQIKSFMAVGDIASAQKIILGELETEFGGLAVAAGQTLAGRMEILRNTFGDIQETIGAALLPALSSVAEMLLTGLNSEIVQTALTSLTDLIKSTLPVLADLARYFLSVIEDGDAWNDWAADLPASIKPFVKSLGEVITVVRSIILHFAGLDDARQRHFGWMVDIPIWLQPVLTILEQFGGQIVDLFTRFVSWRDVLMAVGVVVASMVIPALAGIVAAAAPVIGVAAALVGAIALVRTAWETDWGGIRTAVEEFATQTLPILLQKAQEVWAWITTTAIPTLQQWGEAYVMPALDTFINQTLPLLWQKAQEIWGWITGTAIPTLQQWGQTIADFVTPKFNALKLLLDQFIAAVLPPLQAAWLELQAVWNDSIGPALDELWASLGELSEALGLGTGDTDLWKVALGVLKVGLELVVIQVNLLKPLIRALGEVIEFGTNNVRLAVDMFTNFVTGLEGAYSAVSRLITKVGELADALVDMVIPDVLTPGSPTPFEMGLRGIASAIDAMPALKFATPQLALAGGSAGSPGGGSTGSLGGFSGLASGATSTWNITVQANDAAGGAAAGRALVDELRQRGML